ncbi:LOW QUALITY PROTEIN: sperm-associated antigen 17 [Scomber scombrus]|uniref:LOW QUALITY PROTEIN: sperm-associated antigen 17 n=1 Tax=Scomber scombrus TaxID=13677 RepID=A0AAV1P7Z5_SCOSC
MPPKAANKGSAKKPNTAVANKNWETGLTKEQFEEESWHACVCLVAGMSPEDEELIRALALAVQQPQRKLFTSVTWDTTLTMIHELGNPKTKKPDDVPVYYEVTEPAKVLLDAGEEIPCDLMAKILKFQLLQIKDNDQQRREAEQAEEVNAKAPPVSASKDKGGAKGSDKKGKNPPSPVGPPKKTKLKRRDDVDPPQFIDDEPDDGPQHYILLLGFYKPHLIGALDALGVHVSNVIKLNSEHSQTSEGQQEQQTSEGNEKSQPTSPDLDAEVHDGEELPAQAKKLDLFWSDLRLVLDRGPPDTKLHDLAQLSYTVPDILPPFTTQDPEAVLELGSGIFDGVASLIYDCLDWRRQHQHYLDNMRLITVPIVVDPQPAEVVPTPPPMTPRSKKKSMRDESLSDKETAQPPLSTDVDMRYYSNLLDLVPPEVCSVPLILHCMLEQVVVSAEQPVSIATHVAEEPAPHSGPWLDHQLVSYMLQSFLPLVHTEEERSRLLNSLLTTVQNQSDKERLVEKFGAEEPQRRPENPLVIRHHDGRALRLRDVSAVLGFDPAEVEMSMMKLSPVWELIHSAAQQRDSNSCWLAIKQQLQHYCADDVVPWPEVERLFHQSVFESMPLTSPDQHGILQNAARPLGVLEPTQEQTPTINPWDNPLMYAKQQLHNLRTKGPTFLTEDSTNTQQISGRVFVELDLSDIQSCRLRSLFDWHYAEHHDAAIFPQVLQLASEEYRCLDTFRGSHNNTIYIFCHNPMGPHHQCKEPWEAALHTDVKFRKYLEHVADTISDWTRQEETEREAMQLRSLSPADSPKDEKATDSATDENTLEPVIRKDSLKAWKLEQEQLKEEEMAKKSKKDNTPKGKQQKEDAKSTDAKKSQKTVASGKKSRAETAVSSAKTPTESITTAAPPVEDNKELHQTEVPFNGFTGYIMDGRLIHVSGHLQYLFPSDGGQITVENISFVEGSSLMKVAVKKDGHHFYTHINQVVTDGAKTPPKPQDINNDKKEDFKVTEPVEIKIVKQGSLSAVLDNGIHLSYSFYGSTGECTESSQDTETRAQEIFTQGSMGRDLDLSPSKTHTPTSQIRPPEFQSKVCEGQPELPSSPFNSLNLSVPNGLLLQFLREDTQGMSSEEQGVLVRQSFPLHGRGEVGQLQDPSISKELSRTVTSQGAVIRYMRDGSTEVLFADSSVSFSQDSGPVWVPDSEVKEENTAKETEDNTKEQSTEETDTQRGCWLTTIPSGARICTVGTTHKHIPTTSLLAFKATDPITHEVMLSREDLVVSVQNPDGSLSVEHADGTRITRVYQDRPPNTPPHILLHTERVVLVEKEGYATVVMYPERHTAHVFLADGTVITGNNNGAYQVFPSNLGLLQIHSDGKCVYSSDSLITPSPKGDTSTNQPGSYTMSHTDKVACDITDPDGNHFQVLEDGQISVLNFSPAPSTLKHHEEEPEEEEDREMARLHEKHREHSPRLFLVHEDGSGTELLSSQTVEELLYQAYSEPTIALLKEPLPDTEDEFGITIIKPSYQSVWSRWLLGKQNPDITPPNLRNRSWHDFPREEKKTLGPLFGTEIGQGLTLRERSDGSAAQRQPVRSCPKVLKLRELYQYRPFTTPLKHTVDTRLKEYIECLMEREQISEEVMVKDPRTVEECVHASDLLNLVLSFAEEEGVGHTFDKRSSVDIASLYSQGVGATVEKSDVSEDTATAASYSFAHEKESKWNERLTQYRHEICEEKACRVALRKKIVVPYFHPENIPLYQNLLQHQTPDMKRLSMHLPPIRKTDNTDIFLKDAPQENTPRPLNPTPSQSASHAGRSDKMPKKRPTNPTPQTAGDSSWKGSTGQCKAVQLDVTGKPRRTKVRLPSSILSSKPRSVPNQQFLSVEEPVRRKCRTISLTDPNVIIRGFQLLPSRVDFGTLLEGTSSAITVVMKNVGVDTCRFHVKQPSPATGLRVIYNPGPLQLVGSRALGQSRARTHARRDDTLSFSITREAAAPKTVWQVRATGFCFGCLVTFSFERRNEGWSGWSGNTERVSGEKRPKRGKGGVPPNPEQMMLICRRPRHREIGYRLAADGVTELAAPPGRSLPSDVTGVGAACARL